MNDKDFFEIYFLLNIKIIEKIVSKRITLIF